MLENSERWPRISDGRCRVLNRTYLASLVGPNRSISFFTGKPIHGMTMDQASTQRSR